MLETLVRLDREFFFLLNALHVDWLDPVMIIISETWPWVPMYLAIIVFLYWRMGWRVVPIVICAAILVGLCDVISTQAFKEVFERLRPCHQPEFQNLVYAPAGCGGQYGFVSSHAANSFGIATFFVLLFRRKYRFFFWLYAYAVIVSYSRLYLGKHYPADLAGGAMLGAFIALLIYRWYRRLAFTDTEFFQRYFYRPRLG